MRKLSFWASRHPWGARVIIVLSLIMLNIIAVLTGLLLLDMGIHLPLAFILSGAALFGFSYIFYPRVSGKRSRTYQWQKTMDILLAAACFIMIAYLGNHPDQVFRYKSPLGPVSATVPFNPDDSLKKAYKPIREFSANMKGEDGKLLKWKERKKLLKEQVRAIKGTQDLSRKEQAGLIILSILVAAGLLYLVGALACTLSCNGSDAAAVIVGVGGAALIIFLLFVVIRKISQRQKSMKTKPDPTRPGG
ncbi:MAG: hypothetical protein ACO25B_06705 [Chitinophagaceae bacterium]